MPESGRVKFFDDRKGWGVIVGDDGQDFIAHAKEIRSMFKTLERGEVVIFEVKISPRGQRRALNIRRQWQEQQTIKQEG